MQRDLVLLRRAEREGGVAEAYSEAERRIVRRLARRGLVKAPSRFGVLGTYSLTPRGKEVLSESCEVTENGGPQSTNE